MHLSLVRDTEVIAEEEEDNFEMLGGDVNEFENSDVGRARQASGGFVGLNVINANYMENQFKSTVI